MLNKCCLSGHSKIYDSSIERNLYYQAEELITKHNVEEFFVGNYGDFDRISTKVINKLKLKHPVKLILVIPYLTKEINENKNYYQNNFDEICIADISNNTPKKLQIIKSNEYMINKSNFLLCYVNNNWGGAYNTLKYAKQKSKFIFNIANKKEC